MSTFCAAQEPVDVAPISWWQHAGMNVLREARHVTGRECCKNRHVCPRQHLRQRYQMIYLEHRSSTFWQRCACVWLRRLSVNFCSAYLCFSTTQPGEIFGMLVDTDALPHKPACTSQVDFHLHSGFEQCCWWHRMQRRMSGITCGTRREMKRIESGLSTLDIALFRWRAWAVYSEQVQS